MAIKKKTKTGRCHRKTSKLKAKLKKRAYKRTLRPNK